MYYIHSLLFVIKSNSAKLIRLLALPFLFFFGPQFSVAIIQMHPQS